jgi:hypothetical protein
MTLTEIKPATFWLVAQCLNLQRHHITNESTFNPTFFGLKRNSTVIKLETKCNFLIETFCYRKFSLHCTENKTPHNYFISCVRIPAIFPFLISPFIARGLLKATWLVYVLPGLTPYGTNHSYTLYFAPEAAILRNPMTRNFTRERKHLTSSH